MPTPIRILINGHPYPAELNDSPCANLILDALPLEKTGQTWGQEIYFLTDLNCESDSSMRDEFEVGELGFWPTGNAFCIFYGPTPASLKDEPRMADPGLPVGFLLEEDLSSLNDITGEVQIRVELA